MAANLKKFISKSNRYYQKRSICNHLISSKKKHLFSNVLANFLFVSSVLQNFGNKNQLLIIFFSLSKHVGFLKDFKLYCEAYHNATDIFTCVKTGKVSVQKKKTKLNFYLPKNKNTKKIKLAVGMYVHMKYF